MSKDDEIDFLTDKTFSGEFDLPEGIKAHGKLIYEKNKNFSLRLFSDKPLESLTFPKIKDYREIIDIPTISGRVFDENDNTFYVSFKNCKAYNVIISSIYKYNIYFPYAIFSNSRIFDFEANDNLKVDLFFNIWNEFCYPQGFKQEAKYEPSEIKIKLKNKFNISFEQEVHATFLNEDKIFDTLFIVRPEIDNVIKEKLNNDLQSLFESYKNKIDLKLPETHQWYISLNNFSKIDNLRKICWQLEQLLICLTNDFNSSLNKIKVQTRYEDDPQYFYAFYMLFNKKLPSNELNYYNLVSPFKMKTFSREEWEIIFNNLFKYSQKLDNFFLILHETNKDNTLLEFNIVKYIDAIGAIGLAKGYKAQKYELTLKNFVKCLDKIAQKVILDEFRKNLDYIKPEKKKNTKKNWGLIGEKISELRALSVHFANKNIKINLQKAANIYPIFNLIIFDYIFEILEIDELKRNEFKKFYLTRIFRLDD